MICLHQRGCGHIKIVGGGGTILPSEIEELQKYGIDRVYSPDDGRAMGLQGMINDLLNGAISLPEKYNTRYPKLKSKAHHIAQLISSAENFPKEFEHTIDQISNLEKNSKKPPVLGITGIGGLAQIFVNR